MVLDFFYLVIRCLIGLVVSEYCFNNSILAEGLSSSSTGEELQFDSVRTMEVGTYIIWVCFAGVNYEMLMDTVSAWKSQLQLAEIEKLLSDCLSVGILFQSFSSVESSLYCGLQIQTLMNSVLQQIYGYDLHRE